MKKVSYDYSSLVMWKALPDSLQQRLEVGSLKEVKGYFYGPAQG